MQNIHCIILTGSGDKSFIAGADIKKMVNMDSSEALIFASKGHELTKKIENFNKQQNKVKYIQYILTSKGVAERTRLTLNFMKRKMKEYDELKKELKKK